MTGSGDPALLKTFNPYTSTASAAGAFVRVAFYEPLIISTVAGGGFFFSSRRRHTRLQGDWSSDVCSSDLCPPPFRPAPRQWTGWAPVRPHRFFPAGPG